MVRLLERDDAILMVIDVQGKLVPVMDPDLFPRTVSNIKILIETAHILKVPIILTEQYPKGLGPTMKDLMDVLEGKEYDYFEKMTFCCLRDKNILDAISRKGKKQIILCGVEAHVCVYQTGIDLLQAGYEVYIVSDAVCSRRKENAEIGIRSLVKAGACELPTETVGFSLLKVAGTPEFKAFAKLIK